MHVLPPVRHSGYLPITAGVWRSGDETLTGKGKDCSKASSVPAPGFFVAQLLLGARPDDVGMHSWSSGSANNDVDPKPGSQSPSWAPISKARRFHPSSAGKTWTGLRVLACSAQI
jgi:hypothetical protein